MKLTEKIAYMKGLMDGMELDTSTKEGKAILQMAEVMEEMGVYIDDSKFELLLAYYLVGDGLGKSDRNFLFGHCSVGDKGHQGSFELPEVGLDPRGEVDENVVGKSYALAEAP